MRDLLRRFWNDEAAFVISADLILITTIVILGTIVGLATLRDQVVQELGDLGAALGNLNQSYSFAGHTIVITHMGNSVTSTVNGSNFIDQSDFCEEGTTEGSSNNDSANNEPGCIDVTVAATTEGT